ncbi:hypothetical protein GCM10010319_45150 [Streptomyces blastmyceticus]|uniref:Uncharacterized protein n=1 Tax=Streptomyces blastmyceticus TaxID=68180 RepID=A0ABP3H8V3_9ACTN
MPRGPVRRRPAACGGAGGPPYSGKGVSDSVRNGRETAWDARGAPTRALQGSKRFEEELP